MDAKEGGLTGKAGIWPYVQLSVNQEATTFSGGTSLYFRKTKMKGYNCLNKKERSIKND